MTNRYFSLLTPDQAIFDGHHVLADTGSLYNGNLVMVGGGTSGSLVASTGSAIGMAYDLLAMKELPTTQELVANIGGDYCNHVSGHFYALLGPDLFTGAAIPAVASALYDNCDGTISSTAGGHKKIGQVLSHQTVQHKDGALTVARCYFDFTAVL